ncbi:MAG: hypothetical protein AAFV77_07240, partial [Planctomycetota bacterium]
LWDLGGENDAYEAVESSMGVGLHGVGMLIDDGGDDTYLVRQSWGQGVGHVGFGAIIDRGGNDQYTSGRSSQAHGSTRGAGVIVDLAGNDTYTIPDSTARSELYLGRVVAMGQGCGYGRRADLGDSRSMAGGFGVLVDGAGDDHYSAMAWSQGAAAHFAVGIHVDLDGNDTYNANPERMANPYTSEEQWIAENQYAGHARDGALGIFVDGAGNDEYVLRANCGGSGDLNSVGFFWDRSGDDRYTGLEIDPSPRNANWTRPPMGTITIYPEPFRSFRDDLRAYGVFLDTGGTDTYEGLESAARNSHVWSEEFLNGRAVGIDR